jgi:hypothetical protein
VGINRDAHADTGVQLDIMDISKVFTVGHGFLATYPDATDEQLGKRIVDFVQTIRKN